MAQYLCLSPCQHGVEFKEKNTVKCFRPNIDIRELKGFHEEGYTRMILHCVHSDAEFLLIPHFDKMSCKQLRVRTGISKKPKYLPLHAIPDGVKTQFVNWKPFFHSMPSQAAMQCSSVLAIANKKRHGRLLYNTTCY